MRPETKIIINERFAFDVGVKKYRATQEQIEQNRREIAAQRERDERARDDANKASNEAVVHRG
jgi:hypothetical protein